MPFDLKDSLKRRGYRWSDGSDGRARSWYVDVGEAALDDEIKFLKTEIYLRDVEPRLQTLTAFTRFSAGSRKNDIMVTIWSPDGSVCPICAGPGRESTRYPAALCEPCQASIRDRDGQSVQMFNEGFSGGLEIRTATGALTLPEAEKLPLFVRGIECRAREHRFGGVVVQPLEAWDAAG